MTTLSVVVAITLSATAVAGRPGAGVTSFTVEIYRVYIASPNIAASS